MINFHSNETSAKSNVSALVDADADLSNKSNQQNLLILAMDFLITGLSRSSWTEVLPILSRGFRALNDQAAGCALSPNFTHRSLSTGNSFSPGNQNYGYTTDAAGGFDGCQLRQLILYFGVCGGFLYISIGLTIPR